MNTKDKDSIGIYIGIWVISICICVGFVSYHWYYDIPFISKTEINRPPAFDCDCPTKSYEEYAGRGRYHKRYRTQHTPECLKKQEEFYKND
jgi:hypothetical protein